MGMNRQTTLLRLLEDWRGALDKNQYIAAVPMNLPKAFDCLPHDILLDKLSAYGVSHWLVRPIFLNHICQTENSKRK
jgi:hypothetical protein